uniref:Waprin-like protein n=1 Tax=Python regius TaxID=51751 RepID=A0A098LWQ3_PYTRG
MKAVRGLLLLGLLALLAELPLSVGQNEKPGVCPRPPPGTVTPCVEYCKSDWECRGIQKCCRYACMRACMDPV